MLQYLGHIRSASPTRRESAWYAHWIAAGFEAAEKISSGYAQDGPYVFGANATLADALLVPQMYNARRFDVPLDDFPRLIAVTDACNERPAFADAAPESQPDYPGPGA